MKKKILLPLMALCFGLPVCVTAQPSFNYASAFVGTKRTDKQSLIRTIDDTSALIYYYDNTLDRGVIARISLSLNFRKALLPHRCTLNDMRINGDNVYFCGRRDTNAIIGHIKLSEFWTPNRTVTMYRVNNNYATNLFRMAAYDVGSYQKVVIVGELLFTEHPDPINFHCPYDTTYYDPELDDSVHYYYYNCRYTVILEVDFNGASYNNDKYLTTTKIYPFKHLEFIDDVIETQNHIAFVGYFTNHHTTIIHKCMKNNVVGTFNGNHWCYLGIDEGHSRYRGCLMNGDTIAVSSLSTYNDVSGAQQFSTNIRVFDMANMDNTHALRVPLNTKTEPYDLMYMPKDRQLVLLQNINLPSMSNDKNTFLHIDPYATVPYNAKCWYEAYWDKPFNCLSRLNDTTYVASGGEYWCMKNMNIMVPDSCYKSDVIEITPIKIEKKAEENDRYYSDSNLVDTLNLLSFPDRDNITPSCLISNY